jgi:hypothetical protein
LPRDRLQGPRPLFVGNARQTDIHHNNPGHEPHDHQKADSHAEIAVENDERLPDKISSISRPHVSPPRPWLQDWSIRATPEWPAELSSHVKRRARQVAPTAPTCGLKADLDASRYTEGKRPEALQRVGNLRTLSYGAHPAEAHIHHEQHGATRSPPRGGLAPRQGCLHRTKTNSIVFVERVAVQPRFESRRNCLPLTSNVIGGALSAGPASASPEAFGVRAGPLDTVVLSEIGAPSAIARHELCAGLRPPCTEGAGIREIVDKDITVGGDTFVARR